MYLIDTFVHRAFPGQYLQIVDVFERVYAPLLWICRRLGILPTAQMYYISLASIESGLPHYGPPPVHSATVCGSASLAAISCLWNSSTWRRTSRADS